MLKALLVYLFLLSPSGINLANSSAFDFYKQFVPAYCCYTNDCCWEVKESELTHLGGNQWKINATGQIVEAQPSPLGGYHRCACDYNTTTGQWDKHDKANTRCLFVPFQGT